MISAAYASAQAADAIRAGMAPALAIHRAAQACGMAAADVARALSLRRRSRRSHPARGVVAQDSKPSYWWTD